MKLLNCLIVSLVFSFSAHASHLLGGEIIWKCKPNGKYQFTLVVYRDCGGITISTTPQTLANNAGVSITCNYVSTTDVVPACYTGTTSCSGATSGQGRMQKYVFRSGDITLTGTPPAGGWYFTWNSCCRPGSISNGPSNQGYLLRAVMFPYTPPGSTTPLSAGTTGNPTCFDNSPNFLEDPQVISCTNVDSKFNNFGYDPDLDSLHYDWASPLQGSSWPGNSVTFASGFSASSPLPSGSGSVAGVVNGETGEITFKSAKVGSWATCVKVEEWRGGQKVGEIFRDIPIVTLACTPPSGLCSAFYVNEEPTMDLTPDPNQVTPITLSPVTNSSGDTVLYDIAVNVGDTVKFKVSSSDPYPNPNCSSQNIEFSASGGNLSSASNYGNANSCLFNPPCATITSLNTGGIYTYPGINDVEFEWVTDVSHLNYSGFSETKTYSFYLKMSDDQCPINRVNSVMVRITINGDIPGIPSTPNKCVNQLPQGNQIQWQPSVDTGAAWGYYLIHHYDTSNIPVVLDTIWNWSANSYLHTGADTNQLNLYTIQAVSGDGLSSLHSDTIGSPISVSFASLNSLKSLQWSSFLTLDTNNIYELLKVNPISGQSNVLATVNGLSSYIDSSSSCFQKVYYEIVSNSNCLSTSSQFIDIDNTIPEPIEIKALNINNLGQTEIYLEKSSDSDVVMYNVYQLDTSSIYIPVDSITTPISQSGIVINTLSNSGPKEIIVLAQDSCGNQSSLGNSSSLSSIYLQLDYDGGDFQLDWNSRQSDSGSTYYSIYEAKYNGSLPGNYSLIASTVDTSADWSISNEYENHCFYISASNSASNFDMSSNRVCYSFLSIPEIENQIRIYPNPSTGKVYFEPSDAFSPVVIEIYNLKGVKLLHYDIHEYRETFNLNLPLSPGHFLVRIISNDGRTKTRAIIIQK